MGKIGTMCHSKCVLLLHMIISIILLDGVNMTTQSVQPSKDYQELVNVLLKLDLLPLIVPNNSRCFSLVKITKEYINARERVSSNDFGLHLYFKEIPKDEDDTHHKTGSSTVYGRGTVSRRDTVFVLKENDTGVVIGNCRNEMRESLSRDASLTRLSLKRVDDNSTLISKNDESANKSMATVHNLPKDESEAEGEGGLSRTQVVVIATCSAVIGTFFIIAGIMRIHSCVKRYRVNRDMALSKARRSSSVGFNGTSINQTRRASADSKTSRQSNGIVKEEADTEVKAPSYPSNNSQLHTHDHKPLLPVSSLNQCSDGINSSHSSCIYIDESTINETVDKHTDDNCSGSEDGSEDDPLLHKSTDSPRGSVDVLLGNDNDIKVENEYMTSQERIMTSINKSDSISSSTNAIVSPSRSLTSPQRSEIFEPGGDSDGEFESDSFVNEAVGNEDDSLQKETKRESNGNDTCKNKLKRQNEVCSILDKSSSLGTSMGRSTESTEFDMVTGFPVYARKGSASRQYSVDYFEVDDYGVEIINPIFEEDESEANESDSGQYPCSNGIVSTGFNQSDNSLNENPSYQYGNQTEYCVYGDYRAHFYFTSMENISDHDPRSADMCFGNSKENTDCNKFKSLSVCETGASDTISPMNESFENCANKTKVSRMFSSESYFGKKVTGNTEPNGITYDKSNNVFTISSSSVKSEIVPLAIYNSGNSQDGK